MKIGVSGVILTTDSFRNSGLKLINVTVCREGFPFLMSVVITTRYNAIIVLITTL